MTPAEVFHVAEFVEDEMEARDWSLNDLAVAMCDGTERDCQICRCSLDFLMLRDPRIRIGDTANKLAKAFGTDAQFWLNLEETWMNQTSKN